MTQHTPEQLRAEADRLWAAFDAIPATKARDKEAAMKAAAAASRKAHAAEARAERED